MKELKDIHKVHAPDFLFDKIQAKIKRKQENASMPQMVLGAAFLVIVVSFNGLFLSQKTADNNTQNKLEVYSEAMQLNTSNQLYYE